MRHNPYRYGRETWSIGDRVHNFTVKRPHIWGTVTNLIPTGDRRSFLVMVTWDRGNAVSTHLNGNRLYKAPDEFVNDAVSND